MPISPEQTIAEIALAHPSSVRIFEALGIDYCCGGKRSLATACAHARIPLQDVLNLLEQSAPPSDQSSALLSAWNHAPLTDLTRYIVARHHEFVRRETPAIQSLFEKVLQRHGPVKPAVVAIQALFSALAEELAEHMTKEEHDLFPQIQTLGARSRSALDSSIQRLIAEHDATGSLLTRMRELSHGYEVPDGACATFRALYHSLEQFEQDLHRHVHLENNVLFPRALAAQQGGAASVATHY